MKYWKNTATLDAFVPELAEVFEPAEAELAVIGSKPIKLTDFPKLKGLFKCGVGRDNVPFSDCEDRGVAVCLPSEETRNIVFEETANFAVHLIFRMLYAEIGSLDEWEKMPRYFLGDRNVLIMGNGNIGKRVGKKLKGFVKVTIYDPVTNQPEELFGLVSLADVVSLHMPLTEETRGFINAEKLSWMKSGAALVNAARGPIVDEAALLTEIQSGRIRAAFDVFWQEPYHGPLRKFNSDRFLMSPHVASTCEGFLKGLAKDLKAFVIKLH